MILYILDLDNCLIYSSYSQIDGMISNSKRKWHYLYHRPFLMEFLKYIQKSGEIVFYTSSKKDYAHWVVSTFQLKSDYKIFSRKFCTKKSTDFGEIYYKSIRNIKIEKEYDKIVVLDDRSDLWDETGIELHDIKPFMGEGDDHELQNWVIKRLKSRPKIGHIK